MRDDYYEQLERRVNGGVNNLRVGIADQRWRCYFDDCANLKANPQQFILNECADDPVTCPACRKALELPPGKTIP